MTHTIGRFHLLKRLGGGGFGEVFLAEDPSIGRKVAIKVFRPKDENLVAFATSSDEEGLQVLRARFLNEAKILAALENTVHVVNVLEYGELPDGAPYYVMPYLPHALADELGKDVFDVRALEELPESERPRALSLERSLTYLEQILRGMAASHARGLVHRDIKPGNLMLTEEGDIRIVDFGIAKAPDTTHSTVSHLGLGSRHYMAPEQRESAKHVDARADVYAIGRVAYRMLTGRLPVGRFADPNVAVPALGKPMNDLLLAALSEDRDGRPADAGQMLERFLVARKSVGQTSASDTGTWVGDAEAGIRDDLKPLRARIAEMLHATGRIGRADFARLQALAAVADLDEAGLNRLIHDTLSSDKRLQAKKKLADFVAQQVQRQGRALTAAEQETFEDAAQAVGWDPTTLEALSTQAGQDLSARSTTRTQPDTTSQKPEGAQPDKGRLIGIAAALLVVVGTVFGIYQWRQGQIADAESKRADITRPTAPSSPPITDTDRARIRIIQDYLNRLGYRVGETGEADLRTIEAIKRFESEHLVIVTGTPDEVLRSELAKEFNRRDADAWEKATTTHTDAAYIAYHDAFPKGAHVDKVDDLRDAAAWAYALEQDTEAAYQLYLERYPQGKHTNDVPRHIAVARERVAEGRRLEEARKKADEKKRIEEAELARNGWFRDNGNGTLTDSKTGLLWAQHDNGSDINWNNAQDYCKEKGMRLPTIEELEGIHNPSGGFSTSCGLYDCRASPLFKLSGFWFKSGTLIGTSSAWSFNLANGNRFQSPITDSNFHNYRALCVRRSS